jgi:hypothetical protein
MLTRKIHSPVLYVWIWEQRKWNELANCNSEYIGLSYNLNNRLRQVRLITDLQSVDAILGHAI